MNGTSKILQWRSWALLNPDTIIEKYAIIILNTPILFKTDFLLPLWSKAHIRVLVDGGANNWLKWLETNKLKSDSNLPQPTLVTGDMDSIEKPILANFQSNKNTEVIVTPDQDETDFTKAIREIKNYSTKNNIQIKNIITIVDTIDRFDHIMGNIQTLYHTRNIAPEYNLFILSSSSLTWLLDVGEHNIEVPEQLRKEWCALIPVGTKCDKISTTGLKWNLDNQSLYFGGLVSTSNAYSGVDTVTVKTSNVIVWSMGLTSDYLSIKKNT